MDAPRIYARVRALAAGAVRGRRLPGWRAEGVKVMTGAGRLTGPRTVAVGDREISADIVLIATGARPRVLPGAVPDGERLLTCRQLYDLAELPGELIVVGSGVTGAEFASAYQALGSQVTLVSSRDRVLPHEDADAAVVVEDVFRRRGMTVLGRSRAVGGRGARPTASWSLLAGRPDRARLALPAHGRHGARHRRPRPGARPGSRSTTGASSPVDRVSRTSAPGVYAAGDCTGVMMLASVAAMQGRIAMWHALGEAVQPLRLSHVAATIFTEPEIATVGVSQQAVDAGQADALVVKLPLATNARAKMHGLPRRLRQAVRPPRAAGIVLGGVVVAPRASELILGVSLAVEQHADRRPDGAHVRRVPVADRQHHRGRPPAHAAAAEQR